MFESEIRNVTTETEITAGLNANCSSFRTLSCDEVSYIRRDKGLTTFAYPERLAKIEYHVHTQVSFSFSITEANIMETTHQVLQNDP